MDLSQCPLRQERKALKYTSESSIMWLDVYVEAQKCRCTIFFTLFLLALGPSFSSSSVIPNAQISHYLPRQISSE